MSTATLFTAEQLSRMPDDGFRYELVAGELKKMTPASWRHGSVASRLDGWLSTYVEAKGLGMTLTSEAGFLVARDPDTVRAPDIAFIHKDRLPAVLPEEAFWPGAPDLAVEVLSPGDTFREIDEKAKMWLKAGTRMVWVINPAWRTVTIYRSGTDVKTITDSGELEGEDVVPGFRCRVRELFFAV
jgi:Uma2 family endonuclease